MNRQEIAARLDALELRGRQMIVHASLASFGTVEGGADTVCAALMDAVGPRGTMLMPAFTCAETLPSLTEGATESAIPFHPDLSVSAAVGAVAETFRRCSGVMRSNHPTHSFSAWGHNARGLLSTQRDNNVLGPLKKLNVVRGDVLLVGTTLRAASVIFLAEEQSSIPYLARRTAVRVNASGYDERVVLENVPGCGFAFDRLEPKLDPTQVERVELAHGWARRISVRYLVGLAAAALRDDPAVFICERTECESCVAKRNRLDQFARERKDAADGPLSAGG